MTSRRNRHRQRLSSALLLLRIFVVVLLLFFAVSPDYDVAADSVYHLTSGGPESLAEGRKLYQTGNYDKAALYYWRAVLLQANNSDKYTVEEAFQGFLGCYAIQDRTVDGFLFIAKEVIARKQKDMAIQYIDQALA